MHSILHGLTRADVDPHPFPHVVVDGALPEAVYQELEASMPPAETLLCGRELENNTPYHFPARRILSAEVAPVWRELVLRHTSREFFEEVVTLFGLGIDCESVRTRIRHPEQRRLRRVSNEPNRRISRSFGVSAPQDDAHAHHFSLDCQIVYGSPVTTPTRCHPVHVDRQVALYAGLLYFRRPGDDSRGGDLELYRFRGPRRAYDAARIVDDSLVERVKTIPYAANRLVFFIHSSDALHAVSVRSATPHPRLHVNFLAESAGKLWELRDCA